MDPGSPPQAPHKIALRKSTKIFGRTFSNFPLDFSKVVNFDDFDVKLQFCTANTRNGRLRGPRGHQEYSQSTRHRILPKNEFSPNIKISCKPPIMGFQKNIFEHFPVKKHISQPQKMCALKSTWNPFKSQYPDLERKTSPSEIFHAGRVKS